MTAAQRFIFHQLEEVVYSAPVAGILPETLERRGIRHPLVLAAKSLSATGALDDLTTALPGATFVPAPSAHAPRDEILVAAEAARSAGADGIVAIGGGSAIDGAKGVALALAADLSDVDGFDDYLFRFADGVVHKPQLPDPGRDVIAVPTTLSGAEFTGAFGMLDKRTGAKSGCVSADYGPRVIIYDPDIVAHTPTELWNGAAARLVDHAVEGLISRRRTVMNDAMGLEALRLAREALGGRSRHEHDISQRASWLAMYPLENAGLGLSHAIGHIIGPRYGIPHGVTSAIMLPNVMAFVIGYADEALSRIASALDPDGPATPEAAVDAVRALMQRLGLPQRLREFGVERDDLAHAAADVMHDFGIAACPRPVTAAADVESVLTAAW